MLINYFKILYVVIFFLYRESFLKIPNLSIVVQPFSIFLSVFEVEMETNIKRRLKVPLLPYLHHYQLILTGRFLRNIEMYIINKV